MDQLSKHFSREEFDCKDGTHVPDILRSGLIVLCENLEILREELERPIIITSGYRTPTWNKLQGGATNSFHLLAQAADIKIRDRSPGSVGAIIEILIKDGKMMQGGIGLYDTWVHYDTRGIKARWDYRTKK